MPSRTCGRPTSRAASPSSSGLRGRACARSSAARATGRSRSRSPGRSSRSTSASPRRSSSTRPVAAAPARAPLPEPTLYLFDGYNLLHAGGFEDRRELTDALASFVALHGARGVLVWDGVGRDEEIGPLAV